jgi:penicillin amidase
MHQTHRGTLSIVILAFFAVLIGGPVPSPATAADTKSVASKKKNQITILRDNFGVPHVFAPTEPLLWYGVGYAQGQDRLWQAEILRRSANGMLAEVFGSNCLAGDVGMRTLFGPSERLSAIYNSASSQARAALQGFAAGMNAWMEEAMATGQLPVEFTTLGFTPAPWVEEDSVAILSVLLYTFGETGADELTAAGHLNELISRLGPGEGSEVFSDTHWLNDPDAPTTVPAEEGIELSRRRKAASITPTTIATGRFPDFNSIWTAMNRNFERAGLKRGPASNAIVIGPELSEDGRALLLSGPQMGYSTPQNFHEIGIHGAGIDVTGVEIAGVPWILNGVTDAYAWTLTSGGTDNMDVYAETINPLDPDQYRFEGQWFDFDCRQETFGVREEPDVTEILCETGHGPVVGTTPDLAFSLKRAVRGHEMDALEVFFDLIEARSASDMDTALSGFPACLNFFYADYRANIAYWHTGRIPVRAEGDDPWLPHDGTGSAEWQGFIPWDEMPHILNPTQGWISNWNNKPARNWDNSAMDFWNWGPVQRVNTLNNRLSQLAPRSATTDTLEELNILGGWTTDTPSGCGETVFVSTLLDDMLARIIPEADPRIENIVPLLASWDGLQLDIEPEFGRYDSPAVAIFNTWWQKWVDRVFADDLGTIDLPSVVGNLTYRMLADAPALPLLHDYLGGETIEQAMTGALISTLDNLTAIYGSTDPSDWLQPIAEIVWSPIGAGSVPDTIWMNRGTYNQIIHLGPGPKLYGENVVAPGQSGDPSSPHFADQWLLYANWSYKPMRMNEKDLKGFVESTVVLDLDD